MQKITASRAKQNFGELLETVQSGPVAVERHGAIKAIVCSPSVFEAMGAANVLSSTASDLDARRMARADQQLVEKNRLIKHQQIAIQLLVMADAKRDQVIALARGEVARWRSDRLCSRDYADLWEELLARPVDELAQAMSSETMEWAPTLRQNSPWHVVDWQAY